MNEQKNYDKVKRLFEQEHDFKFDSKAHEKHYVEHALYVADCQYRDEHLYREFPQFEDFLNTHHMDAILHFIVARHYQVN